MVAQQLYTPLGGGGDPLKPGWNTLSTQLSVSIFTRYNFSVYAVISAFVSDPQMSLQGLLE